MGIERPKLLPWAMSKKGDGCLTDFGSSPKPATPNAKFAEVRLCNGLGLQSLQPGTSPLFTRKFQAQLRRRSH